MKLSEQDLIFLILSFIGVIGGPVIGGFMIYAQFYRNPTNEPLWQLLAILGFMSIGMVLCVNHIRECWKKMKN